MSNAIDCNLPWFDNAQRLLGERFQSHSLAHGLLVVAPEGSGKSIFANQIAKGLLCSSQQKRFANPCNHCKACELFESHTHPDFYLIERLVDAKGKQKKTIGIDQIRRLTQKLSESAQFSGWRVAIVTSVSAMTIASFNALLKTLEEPGNDTLLILLAEGTKTIPATIRSRCQLVQPNLNKQVVRDWVVSQTRKSEKEIDAALNQCFNAPFKTIDYIENGGAALEKRLTQLLDGVLVGSTHPNSVLKQSEIAAEECWLYLANYFNRVQKNKLIDQTDQRYAKLSATIAFQLYLKVMDYHRAQLEGSNLNSKLQIESILIQWFEEGRKIRSVR